MKKLFLACTIFLFACNTRAQKCVQRLDSLFTAPGNFEKLNGSVLIAENGQVVYQRSFGFANREDRKPNTAASSFNIGSVTKTFTATAILQLVEKGRLGIDDIYQKYFPAFPYPNITIRHLLTHTSGLTDLETYFRILDSLPDKLFTDADIIPGIIHLKRPLKFSPGNAFDYCNINFELLALLIERLSGMSYPDYIRRHIFKPAGMAHSYFNALPPATPDNDAVTNYMFATLYATDYTPNLLIENHRIKQVLHNLKYLMGDGSIISTAGDLLQYDKALFGGRLLRAATLSLATTPNRLNDGKEYKMFSNPNMATLQYGFGWQVDTDTSCGLVVSHGGHYPGIWTSFIHNISRNQTIIVYDNTDWSGADLLSGMALAILNNRPVKNQLSKKMTAKVYGQTLLKQGADAAFAELVTMKDDSVHFILRERDLNTLGYQFLQHGLGAQSLETFKITALLFQNSANTYDSYGDALAGSNKNEDAIRMYNKALLMDPGNTDTKEKLKKLSNRQ